MSDKTIMGPHKTIYIVESGGVYTLRLRRDEDFNSSLVLQQVYLPPSTYAVELFRESTLDLMEVKDDC